MRLSDDTVCVEVNEGIYLRNNNGALLLKGRHANRALHLITDVLSKGGDPRQTADGLPPAKRMALFKILDSLEKGQFLLPDNSPTCSGAGAYPVHKIHAVATVFGAYSEVAITRFVGKRIVVCGYRDMSEGIVAELESLGKKNVSAVELQEFVKIDGRVADNTTPHAVVVVAGMEQSEFLVDIEGICRAAGIALLPVMLGGHLVAAGPWMLHDGPSCAGCLVLWLGQSIGWRHGNRRGLSEDVQALARSYLIRYASLAVCRYLLSGGSDSSQVTRVFNSVRLVTEDHRLVPHPDCERCGRLVSTVCSETIPMSRRSGGDGSSTVPQSSDILDELESIKDEVLGIFRGVREREFIQLPLCRSEALFAPAVTKFAKQSVSFISSELDYVRSRRRAVLAGLEKCACQRLAWNQAISLPDLSPLRIPGFEQRRLTHQARGSGFSIDGMIVNAIVRATCQRVKAELKQRKPLRIIKATKIDYQAQRFLRILSRYSIQPGMLSVEVPLYIPLVVAATPDIAFLGSGITFSAALRESLLLLTQYIQARENREPCDTEVTPLMSESISIERTATEFAASLNATGLTLDALLQSMTDCRWKGVMVPAIGFKLRSSTFYAGVFGFSDE